MHHPTPCTRRLRAVAIVALTGLAAACAIQPERSTAVAPAIAPADDGQLGVLLMAHGGPEAWNKGVATALEPLGREQPLEIAFGMADAVSLERAVHALEERGAERIAVVRLFVSGESWYERTRQILGLEPGAPERPAPTEAEDHAGHHGHSMEFWRVPTDARFALSTEGLAEAPEMGEVIADRAAALSTDPTREDVLVLAHGPGDDAENTRWLTYIDARAEAIRQRLPFRRVHVETLREDWPEKRAEAEQRIRDFVQRASDEGGKALVIPYRVHGFGPYSKVLDGLDYASSGEGLVPHENVAVWVRRQVEELREGPFAATSGG